MKWIKFNVNFVSSKVHIGIVGNVKSENNFPVWCVWVKKFSHTHKSDGKLIYVFNIHQWKLNENTTNTTNPSVDNFQNRWKENIEHWTVVYQQIYLQKKVANTYGGINFDRNSCYECGVLCTLHRNEINIDLWPTFDIYMLSIEDEMCVLFSYFIFRFICGFRSALFIY